jgi:hypothetical protein
VERPHRQGIAQPTAELARLAASRRELDPAETAIAARAVDVVSSHMGFYVRGRKRFQKKPFWRPDRVQWNFVLPRRNHGGGLPAIPRAHKTFWNPTISRCLSATRRARQICFPAAIKGRAKPTINVAVAN